jgi:hypothetical protein
VGEGLDEGAGVRGVAGCRVRKHRAGLQLRVRTAEGSVSQAGSCGRRNERRWFGTGLSWSGGCYGNLATRGGGAGQLGFPVDRSGGGDCAAHTAGGIINCRC